MISIEIKDIESFKNEEDIAILIAEDKCSVAGNLVEISLNDYLSLNNVLANKYGFPERINCGVKINSEGGVLTSYFQMQYRFTDLKNGRQLYPAILNDYLLTYSGIEYRLTPEIYKVTDFIDKINASQDREERFFLIKEIQQLIGFEDDTKDSVLDEIEVIIPSYISINATSNQCSLNPVLVGADGSDNILDDMDSEIFLEEFHKFDVSKSAYKISKNKFISIPQHIRPYLGVIKEESLKPKSKRKNFIMNPNRYFSEVEDLNENIEDSPFKEIEEFVSSRISHIGVWEPKTNIFIPTGENDWIPKDSIGIRLDENIVFVNPESIASLESKIEKALNNGESSILFEGNEIKVSQEVLEEVRQYSSKKEDISKVKNNNTDGAEKQDVLVSIIKDNLLDELYSDTYERRGEFSTDEIPENIKTTSLYDHQRTGVSWLQESYMSGRRGVLLADDMGLGKTLQCLTFLCWHFELLKKSEIQKTGPYFIVGPKSLLKNWVREIERHVKDGTFPNIYEAHGSKFLNLRKKGVFEVINELKKQDIVLTTYETLRDQECFFRRIEWQAILFDECQKINNPNVLMTEMAKAMATQFSIGITGTPVENRLSELWCIVDTIAPGYLNTYKFFRDKYETSDSNLEDLRNLLTNYNPPSLMLRRMKSDEDVNIPELPEKVVLVRKFPMSRVQENVYNDVISQAQKSTEKGMALKTVNFLKSISVAPHLDDIDRVEDFLECSGKILGTFKILDEIKQRNEKVILFIENRNLQKKMYLAIKSKYEMTYEPLIFNGSMTPKSRDHVVETFEKQKAGFSVIIVSPKAGGAGITLVNANNVIHLDRWWNPAVEDQASDRCYRIGQKKKVTIYHPLTIHSELGERSFDLILDKLLEEKRILSSNVIVPTTFSKEEFHKLFKDSTNCSIKEDTSFYLSHEWRELREKVFQRYGHRCLKCSVTAESGYEIQVDHIKPVSLFPDLKLDFENLQPLCAECNNSKSNTDFTDYRKRKV